MRIIVIALLLPFCQVGFFFISFYSFVALLNGQGHHSYIFFTKKKFILFFHKKYVIIIRYYYIILILTIALYIYNIILSIQYYTSSRY